MGALPPPIRQRVASWPSDGLCPQQPTARPPDDTLRRMTRCQALGPALSCSAHESSPPVRPQVRKLRLGGHTEREEVAVIQACLPPPGMCLPILAPPEETPLPAQHRAHDLTWLRAEVREEVWAGERHPLAGACRGPAQQPVPGRGAAWIGGGFSPGDCPAHT